MTPKTDPGSSAFRWTVSEPILKAGPKGTFDDVAVKDPSIVHSDGLQHLFYTSKGEVTTSAYPATYTSIGYVSAPSLTSLASAERFDLNRDRRLCSRTICAPQILRFAGSDLWYLIAHVVIDAKMGVLPVYLTNRDIADRVDVRLRGLHVFVDDLDEPAVVDSDPGLVEPEHDGIRGRPSLAQPLTDTVVDAMKLKPEPGVGDHPLAGRAVGVRLLADVVEAAVRERGVVGVTSHAVIEPGLMYRSGWCGSLESRPPSKLSKSSVAAPASPSTAGWPGSCSAT